MVHFPLFRVGLLQLSQVLCLFEILLLLIGDELWLSAEDRETVWIIDWINLDSKLEVFDTWSQLDLFPELMVFLWRILLAQHLLLAGL
jgi:hypothetical protein